MVGWGRKGKDDRKQNTLAHGCRRPTMEEEYKEDNPGGGPIVFFIFFQKFVFFCLYNVYAIKVVSV